MSEERPPVAAVAADLAALFTKYGVQTDKNKEALEALVQAFAGVSKTPEPSPPPPPPLQPTIDPPTTNTRPSDRPLTWAVMDTLEQHGAMSVPELYAKLFDGTMATTPISALWKEVLQLSADRLIEVAGAPERSDQPWEGIRFQLRTTPEPEGLPNPLVEQNRYLARQLAEIRTREAETDRRCLSLANDLDVHKGEIADLRGRIANQKATIEAQSDKASRDISARYSLKTERNKLLAEKKEMEEECRALRLRERHQIGLAHAQGFVEGRSEGLSERNALRAEKDNLRRQLEEAKKASSSGQALLLGPRRYVVERSWAGRPSEVYPKVYGDENSALAWMAQHDDSLNTLCRLVPYGTPSISLSLLYRIEAELARHPAWPDLTRLGLELKNAIGEGIAKEQAAAQNG